jgi:hypothetical protein
MICISILTLLLTFASALDPDLPDTLFHLYNSSVPFRTCSTNPYLYGRSYYPARLERGELWPHSLRDFRRMFLSEHCSWTEI